MKTTEFESHPDFRRCLLVINQKGFLPSDIFIHLTNTLPKKFERFYAHWTIFAISIHLVQLMGSFFGLLVGSLSTLFESIERFSLLGVAWFFRMMRNATEPGKYG